MGTKNSSHTTNDAIRRTSTRQRLRALIGGGALLALSAVPISASGLAQDGGAPIKHVLAGGSGATLRNLPDPKGRDVLQVTGDTPLAVYAERAGTPYLKVAAPGGIKVWVFGKYLTESARPGWVEVSGSYINMRPRPQTQNSYPLGQLDRGDRLRFIKRQDATKPMSEDWVQVYSPPDTMGYVLAAETRALPAGASAAILWEAAVGQALTGRADVPVSTKKPIQAAAKQDPTTASAAAGPGIYAKLAEANATMDAALAPGAGPVDYAGLYAMYQAILAMGPDAPTRTLIDERTKRLDLHRDLAKMRADMEAESREREARLEGLRDQAEADLRSNDPLWGRFQTRGWLEQQNRNGEKVYLIRWGADFLAQVQCSSRRYELGLYNGYEIGVQGVPVNSARVATGSYPLIDIDRIEVISARMRDR